MSNYDETPESPSDYLEHLEKTAREKVGSAALAKSMIDQFDYALKLRTGDVIRYDEARLISDDWLHLSGARFDRGGKFAPEFDRGGKFAPEFERGIDVRISEIVWAMDAPYGS